MSQPDKYQGTTLTWFAEKYFGLLALLAIFAGLTLYATDHAATWLGRAGAGFAFAAAALLWIALLFQCTRARPLTALMEAFAWTLVIGLLAFVAGFIATWWQWRRVTLPLVLSLAVFLFYHELAPAPRANEATGYRVAVRLLCLAAAGLLSYLLLRWIN